MSDEQTAERMNALLGELMVGVNALAFQILGNKVVRGPFAGMEIPAKPVWNDGNSSTKLVGSYEFELHDVVAKAVARKPRSIINIGCAEGYYAIGLARLLPQAHVEAVDISKAALIQCAEYAARNGVADRVTVHNSYEASADDADLFVIDNEGAEVELLRGKAERYARSDFVIECHDFMVPNTSAQLALEFQGSHDVETITPRIPPFESYDFLMAAPTVITLLVIAEKRPAPTRWLACWSRERGV